MEEQTTLVTSPLVILENTAGPNILNQNEERPEPVSPTLRPSENTYTLGEWDEELEPPIEREQERTWNFGTFTEQITSQPLYNYLGMSGTQTQTQQTTTSNVPVGNQPSSSSNQQSSNNNQRSSSDNQQTDNNIQQP